jgi:poly(ADP-ribose) glycohydrolase ARH3
VTEPDRARGALLGTFVGDALGMPYEGSPPEAIPEQIEMQEARLGRGTYTDDTQMMIALAESLLEHGRVDEDALGRVFVEAHDPRRGYGSGTTEVLRLIRSGRNAREAARSIFGGEGSAGNGAAMRIAPVAVRYADDGAVAIEAARASAGATHAHPLGIDAALAQAAAITAALRGESPLDTALGAVATPGLRDRLAQAAHLVEARPEPAAVATLLGSSSAGPESVPAAVYAAEAHDSFEAAVTFAIRCGGDTDTIGAMAGAITGARMGATAIPSRWVDALEQGPKGRAYVTALADQLAAASPG